MRFEQSDSLLRVVPLQRDDGAHERQCACRAGPTLCVVDVQLVELCFRVVGERSHRNCEACEFGKIGMIEQRFARQPLEQLEKRTEVAERPRRRARAFDHLRGEFDVASKTRVTHRLREQIVVGEPLARAPMEVRHCAGAAPFDARVEELAE
jgi:hypothetical protein